MRSLKVRLGWVVVPMGLVLVTGCGLFPLSSPTNSSRASNLNSNTVPGSASSMSTNTSEQNATSLLQSEMSGATTNSSASNPVNFNAPFLVAGLQVRITNEAYLKTLENGVPTKPGDHWVEFMVSLTNMTGKSIMLKQPMFEMSHLDAFNNYKQSLFPVSAVGSEHLNNGLVGKTLKPGATLRGVLPFETPKSQNYGLVLKVSFSGKSGYGIGPG